MTAPKPKHSDTSMLSTALEYAARGWRVFPLGQNTKKPVISRDDGGNGCHDATTDARQIHEWWKKYPHANIGWTMGDGYVAIDEDTYKGADLSSWLLPPTLQSKTASGGLHHIYHYAGELPCVPENELGLGICVKAKGGYIVAPRSLYRGKRYQFVDDQQPIAELPEPIAELIRNHRAQPTAKTDEQPGADEGDYWLHKALARTSDGNGDSTGNWLAQQLLIAERNGKTVDVDATLQAYAAKATVDQRHPFTPRDAERWRRSAEKSAMVQRGEPARSQTHTSAQAQPHETRQPNTDAETPSVVSVWRPNVQTARGIVEKEIAPARWAVRELFTEGLNVLAGKPKRGKSTLLLHVETVIAKGGVALGKIHVQQGDALLLALEDNDRRMKERLMRQLGDDMDAPDHLYIEFNWPRLDQGGLQALDEWMDEHPDTRIIGIDTFKRVKPAAKSSATPMYDADYDALQMLQAWAIARHVAVVALLHLRKQPAPEDPLDEISGSTGIVAAADNIVVMRQYNGVTSLVRKGRDYTDDEEWVLEGDAESLLWKITGDAAVTRVSRERQQLYTALKEHPTGATPSQLAQRLGKSANGVRVMLYRAMQSGDEHVYKVDDMYLYKESNACNESNGSNARNGSNAPITEPLRITRGSNADVMAYDATNTDGFKADAQSITPLLPLRGLSSADACEHPQNMQWPHWKGGSKTMCGACSQLH